MRRPPPASPTAILIGTLFFTVVGVVAAFTQGYVQQDNIDPVTLASESRFNRHHQLFTLFYSKILLDRTRTSLTVPYKLPSTNQILLLGYRSTSPQTFNEYLFAHPQLNSITWSHLQSGSLHLYQRQTDYSSIEAFLATPPPLAQIAVDPQLISLYPNFETATTLDAPIDLSATNYILTTFLPSQQQGDVRIFQTELNTTDAELNELQEIQWYIKAPIASESNPFYLGNINIEFLQ